MYKVTTSPWKPYSAEVYSSHPSDYRGCCYSCKNTTWTFTSSQEKNWA